MLVEGEFLCAFAKLRIATISFVMPVRMPVPLDRFSSNLVFEDFS